MRIWNFHLYNIYTSKSCHHFDVITRRYFFRKCNIQTLSFFFQTLINNIENLNNILNFYFFYRYIFFETKNLIIKLLNLKLFSTHVKHEFVFFCAQSSSNITSSTKLGSEVALSKSGANWSVCVCMRSTTGRPFSVREGRSCLPQGANPPDRPKPDAHVVQLEQLMFSHIFQQMLGPTQTPTSIALSAYLRVFLYRNGP